MERGDACKDKGKTGRGRKKKQSNALCLHGSDGDFDSLSQDPVTAVSLEPQLRPQNILGHKISTTCGIVGNENGMCVL